MKGRLRNRITYPVVALAFFVLALAPAVRAQAASHFLGTITAINGNTLTLKTAQGEEHQVQVPASADLKRIEPGQTSLSAAVPMQFSELATGDRVLVWIAPDSPAGSPPQALRVVAIKAEDLAKRREQEAAEWQQNGVGGLVKSVDPVTGTIVITAGAGPTMHIVTIHTAKSTLLKRYAPASVSYEQAQPAPIDAIHAGDQLMARGVKSNNQITADEVVSGTFRNISGIIASIDPANSTFTLKDLATKKSMTVKVPDDAQMRELPERMAQFIAARLKGTAPSGAGASGAAGGNGGNVGFHQRSGFTQHGAGPGGSMDAQQILSRAPAIHFPDLKKGDAVMLVATPGDAQITAITLIDGVEPLLEAPASQDLLANWSMGSGSGESDAAAGGGQQ